MTPRARRSVALGTFLALCLAGCAGSDSPPPVPAEAAAEVDVAATTPGQTEQTEQSEQPEPTEETTPGQQAEQGKRAEPRPDGSNRSIFQRHILVAYYGTAGTGSLGVLGEAPPDRITKRLRKQAEPYGQSGRNVQIVYELIVTIADGEAGSDGDYSHDIARSAAEKYVRAARRNDAMLLLDLQPGRSTFPSVAKRWAWALRKPYVGLALDPEWRMGPGEVPGETIGSVSAREVNKTSAWLAGLSRRRDLPEKVLIVHQFRRDMVEDIGRIKDRPGLAMLQHVDGFGSQSQKMDTYNHVERHQQFHMGFKLFYDEDSDLFRPREVLRIRPRVEYVSYQ